MKNYILKGAVISFAAVTALSFASCGSKENTDTTTTSPETTAAVATTGNQNIVTDKDGNVVETVYVMVTNEKGELVTNEKGEAQTKSEVASNVTHKTTKTKKTKKNSKTTTMATAQGGTDPYVVDNF